MAGSLPGTGVLFTGGTKKKGSRCGGGGGGGSPPPSRRKRKLKDDQKRTEAEAGGPGRPFECPKTSANKTTNQFTTQKHVKGQEIEGILGYGTYEGSSRVVNIPGGKKFLERGVRKLNSPGLALKPKQIM